jgi:hypothetical protein
VKKKWYNYFVVTEGKSADHGEASAPADPPRRVSDLVPDAESDTVFSAPVADPTQFGDIYHAAKIAAPSHAYTVLKVAEMLRSEHLSSLPVDVKRKSILVALDAAGVKISEIVDDAVQRDRALDTYERVLLKQVEEFRAAKDAENKALQAELEARTREVRAQIEENEQEIRKEQDQLLDWRTRKQVEEARIAEAVSYFVSENPITRSAPSVGATGGSDNVR